MWIAISIVIVLVPVFLMIKRRLRINKETRAFELSGRYKKLSDQCFDNCLAQLPKERYDRQNLSCVATRLKWECKNNRLSCNLIHETDDGGEIVFIFPDEEHPLIFYKEIKENARKEAIRDLLVSLARL
jgi:hypothetical protein